MLHASAATGTAPTLPAVLQPDVLFARRRAYMTNEMRSAHADVARVFYRHSLARFHAGDELNFCHRGANLRRISFNYISYGADVSVGVDYVDRDRYVVVAPLSGCAQVEYRGRVTPIARGQFIILDPMQTFRWEMSADHSHLAVGIPALLVRESPVHFGPTGNAPFGDGPIAITESVLGFFEYVDYLCRELDRPNSCVSTPHVAATLESSLVNLMLAALRAPASGPLVAAEVVAETPACVARAEAFMRAHLTDEIDASDIVAASGVPMRTLYRAFDRYRAMSPRQWLQRERLGNAYAELAAGHSGATTITDVATRYCATNMGRFARAYAAQFGESPSDTLRRSRARRR
jgi:AraC-like DNA-binding protein